MSNINHSSIVLETFLKQLKEVLEHRATIKTFEYGTREEQLVLIFQASAKLLDLDDQFIALRKDEPFIWNIPLKDLLHLSNSFLNS